MFLYNKHCGLFCISNQVIPDLNIMQEIGVGLCCKPNHEGLILFNPNKEPPKSLVDSSSIFTTKVIMSRYSPCIYIKRLSEINIVSNDSLIIMDDSFAYMYPIATDEKKSPNQYVGMIQVGKSGKKRFAISIALADFLELTYNKLCIAFVADERAIIVGQEFDGGSVYVIKNAKNVQYVQDKNIVKQIEEIFNLDNTTEKKCVQVLFRWYDNTHCSATSNRYKRRWQQCVNMLSLSRLCVSAYKTIMT